MSTILSVIVIGGGIGGLTSAVALRRAGHRVTVYEKQSLSGELGAAISIGSNAMLCLKSLGFDAERAQICSQEGTQILDGRTLELLHVLPFNGSAGRTAFRPDLRRELRFLAEDVHGPGIPCRLVEFAAVCGVEPDEGIVHLDDGAGSHDQADLVIAADGVHSSAMTLVLGEPLPARPSGTTAARAVLPVEKLQQNNRCGRILASVPGLATYSVSPDRRRYLLTYWCHAFESLNFVLYMTGPDDDDEAASAAADGAGGTHAMRGETTRADVAAALQHFHPDLVTVCEQLADVLPLWRIYTRPPAPRYSRGRLVAIGDAAHAMLPGANAAILDAVALSTLFAHMPDASAAHVTRRLRIYDKVRAPRVAATQIWSQVPLYANPTDRNNEVRAVMPDAELPETMAGILQWLHGYDVVQHCRDMLDGEGLGQE